MVEYITDDKSWLKDYESLGVIAFLLCASGKMYLVFKGEFAWPLLWTFYDAVVDYYNTNNT